MRSTMTILPVVILAGGLATRLAPRSDSLPKSLMSINGKPFLNYQLALLRQNGIKEVHLCIGRLGKMIQSYIEDLSLGDLVIYFHDEGENPLGTAGAIRNALDNLPKQFFLLYGDSYLRCDYQDLQQCFLNSNKLALMSVFKNDIDGDSSNVIYHDQQIVKYSKHEHDPKMQYIDYGLGLFDKAVFNRYNGPDLETVYQDLLADNDLAGYEVSHRYYEIGSFTGMSQFETYVKMSSEKLSL